MANHTEDQHDVSPHSQSTLAASASPSSASARSNMKFAAATAKPVCWWNQDRQTKS
jgi:hypothetical protein